MKVTPFLPCYSADKLAIPLYLSGVSAGFPSPADDYVDAKIDLNTHLIKHPAATFFARASGHSMRQKGIFDGDLMIVDRARTPVTGSVVVAAVNGDMVCKVLDKEGRRLLAANDRYAPITISEEMDCVIEGVVVHSVRYLDVCTR